MEPSPARVALKWGLFTALVKILMTSIQYATGNYFSVLFPMLTLVILVTGLVLALRELRQQGGGYMSYSEGLSLGVLMFAIIGMLNTTYTMVYTSFIDPGVVAKTLAQTRDFMENMKVPDEQLEKYDEQIEILAEQQKQKGMGGISFITGVLGWIFWGFVLSLIVSGFVSRKKTDPFA